MANEMPTIRFTECFGPLDDSYFSAHNIRRNPNMKIQSFYATNLDVVYGGATD